MRHQHVERRGERGGQRPRQCARADVCDHVGGRERGGAGGGDASGPGGDVGGGVGRGGVHGLHGVPKRLEEGHLQPSHGHVPREDGTPGREPLSQRLLQQSVAHRGACAGLQPLGDDLCRQAQHGAARVAQRPRDDHGEQPVRGPPLIEQQGLAEALVQREVHGRVGRLLGHVGEEARVHIRVEPLPLIPGQRQRRPIRLAILLVLAASRRPCRATAAQLGQLRHRDAKHAAAFTAQRLHRVRT
mmetsp:Transcript_7760/g.18211  ORF Transcript_7760/g.18211 Transcript_7760/m.18211 type:complete len:244 (-) Transcript_7760:548-1279(-)